MPRLISVLIVALAVAFGAPALSVTNATLPGPVSTSLAGATSAADIAALVLAYPDLAATIMAQAAALGIASPAQVLSEAILPSSSSDTISTLVFAACEAAPLQCDLAAAAAYTAAGGASWGDDLALIVVTAAINGVEASGASSEAVASEAAEIVEALQALAGARFRHAIAQAAADATDTTDDSASSLQAAADALNFRTGALPNLHAKGQPPFVELPSEAQTNPSNN